MAALAKMAAAGAGEISMWQSWQNHAKKAWLAAA
jgi:hypothetical protein